MARGNTARVFQRVAVPDPVVERTKLEGAMRALSERCQWHLNNARTNLDLAGRDAFGRFAIELDNATKSIELARMYHEEWAAVSARLKETGK